MKFLQFLVLLVLAACQAEFFDPLELTGSPDIRLTGAYTIYDGQELSASNNGDGFVQPGERIRLDAVIKNQGSGTAIGIEGMIFSVTPDGIILGKAVAVFGNLQPDYYTSIVNTEEPSTASPLWITGATSNDCFLIDIPEEIEPDTAISLFFLFTDGRTDHEFTGVLEIPVVE